MNPEPIQIMRATLEAVMAKTPADQLVRGIKAEMADVISKSAAHGLTSFDRLATSGSDQIQAVISMLTQAAVFGKCQLN